MLNLHLKLVSPSVCLVKEKDYICRMNKSNYILLTLVAAVIALFFLGRWTGMSLGLRSEQVARHVHEAWCRTDDAHAADTTLRIDSLFREELKAAGLRRLRFRLDIVGIDSATVLRPTLRYYADYAPLVEAGRTYAIPTGDGQGIEARLLNLRAETLGTQLYYLLGTLAGFGLLGLGIFTQVGIIRRQDKLAQMREDFSYAMIHDMKSPLTTLLIGLRTLRSGRLDDKPEKKERHFEVLEQEAGHLLELTNRVLTLSKLESGRLILDLDEVELPPLVESLTRTFEAKATKPVRFHTDLQAEIVYADKEHLKEALSNLIDNALKYSKPEGVEVTVASIRKNGYVHIRVRDNGIGIPLSAQRTIFDKFERVLPKGEGKKVSGFGLGLNYVMNVVREHGGYVGVESMPGRYSEFTVSLPERKEEENE